MAIEIDYYITMVSKIKNFVNIKGSSLSLPARAFGLARACLPKPRRRREARRQFCSKKVRISSYNCTEIKLSDFCPTRLAALRAAESIGKIPESLIVVRMGGLEPPRVSPHGPKPCAFTNLATPA